MQSLRGNPGKSADIIWAAIRSLELACQTETESNLAFAGGCDEWYRAGNILESQVSLCGKVAVESAVSAKMPRLHVVVRRLT